MQDRICKRIRIPGQEHLKYLNWEVSDVFKVLSTVEVRMIWRLIPHMKIVKYEGRLGQYGIQGQAVLFAQDLSGTNTITKSLIEKQL